MPIVMSVVGSSQYLICCLMHDMFRYTMCSGQCLAGMAVVSAELPQAAGVLL